MTGDLLVDHYLYAEPRRLSREAPLMVLRHMHDRIGAGGAANVARNLRALGCGVRVFGVVGRDDTGRQLLDLLEQESIDTSGVAALDGYDTPTKTRVLAAEPRRHLQQILRIDREPGRSIEASDRAAVADALRAAAGSLHAVVLSDYSYGVLGGEIGGVVRELAAAGTTAVLDPWRSVGELTGLTAMTPSVEELAHCVNALSDSLHDRTALRAAAEALLNVARCDYLLVTRGNLGMALFGRGLPVDGAFVEAAGTGQVTDVCGAGDTAVAVFTLALAAGQTPRDAMVFANAAAGIVVLEHGATVCRVEALDAALAGESAPLGTG